MKGTPKEPRLLAAACAAPGCQTCGGRLRRVWGGPILGVHRGFGSPPLCKLMDYRRVLEIANPYLGKVVGKYSDWTPLQGRNHPFPEDLDTSDPWQFKNIRVV